MPLGGPRRIGRPGLIGTMARTAVIAGTTSAVVGGMNRRSMTRQQQEADADAYRMQQSAPPAPPADVSTRPPTQDGADRIEELERLAQLHTQGVLDDAEFAAEKARILGS